MARGLTRSSRLGREGLLAGRQLAPSFSCIFYGLSRCRASADWSRTAARVIWRRPTRSVFRHCSSGRRERHECLMELPLIRRRAVPALALLLRRPAARDGRPLESSVTFSSHRAPPHGPELTSLRPGHRPRTDRRQSGSIEDGRPPDPSTKLHVALHGVNCECDSSFRLQNF